MPDKPTLRDTAKALGLVIVQAEKQLGVSKDETKLTIPERIERILRHAGYFQPAFFQILQMVLRCTFRTKAISASAAPSRSIRRICSITSGENFDFGPRFAMLQFPLCEIQQRRVGRRVGMLRK
jgi:hypothetical protein